MPIHIIWGTDTKACENKIENLIDSNISKQWENFNLSKLNGEDENQVFRSLVEIQTPPFGEGARVIVLKNNPLFNVKNDNFAIKFESTLQNIPSNNLFILHNINKPDARIKTTKSIKKLIEKKEAKEHNYNLPSIWDSASQIHYVERIAKEMNIKLAKHTASAIVDSIGTESSRLENGLQKALLYINAKNKNSENLLTVKDIEEVFDKDQSNIFVIIDSLISNNISQALIDINILINQGEPPLRLIAGLTSQIRIYTIVLLLSDEKDLTKISKLAGIANPKRIYFIKNQVRNCSPKFLINLMIKLLDIESYLKRGNNPINVFTENLASLT